jgi:hypothetical protein
MSLDDLEYWKASDKLPTLLHYSRMLPRLMVQDMILLGVARKRSKDGLSKKFLDIFPEIS